MNIRYFDMFAGIGGFRSGLANASDIFIPVGWCEIDRYAQRAYRALYDTGGEYFCDDATKIDKIDVYHQLRANWDRFADYMWSVAQQ